MNKVFESSTMVVHDDRQPITPEEAFELLWAGEIIGINYPPDFSVEDESAIYDPEARVAFEDIAPQFKGLRAQPEHRDECRHYVLSFLRYQEVYR